MGKEERETGTKNEDEDSREEEKNNKEDEIKKDEIMTAAAQETKAGERLGRHERETRKRPQH